MPKDGDRGLVLKAFSLWSLGLIFLKIHLLSQWNYIRDSRYLPMGFAGTRKIRHRGEKAKQPETQASDSEVSLRIDCAIKLGE
jgi:hypothetical protein